MAEGVAILLAGLLVGALGYRLFHAALAVYGFVLGAGLGFLIAGPAGSFGLGVAAAILAGVAGAVAVTLAEELAFAIPGAAIGFLVGLVVGAFAGLGPVSPVLGLLLAGVGAAWGLKAERVAVTVGSAVVGAWFTVSGIAHLVSGGSGEPYAVPGPPGAGALLVATVACAYLAAQLVPRRSRRPPRATTD